MGDTPNLINCYRTYAAASYGMVLVVRLPNEYVEVTLSDRDRALVGAEFIRRHGVFCSKEAIVRMARNF